MTNFGEKGGFIVKLNPTSIFQGRSLPYLTNNRTARAENNVCPNYNDAAGWVPGTLVMCNNPLGK